MLVSDVTTELGRKHFLPVTSRETSENVEPSRAELVEMLRRPDAAAADLERKKSAQEKLVKKYTSVMEAIQEANKQVRDAEYALIAANTAKSNAEAKILRDSKPSNEELALRERSKALRIEAAQHRGRVHMQGSNYERPEDTKDAKRLAEVEEQIASDEAHERSSKAMSGTSPASFRLRKLYPERDSLQIALQKYRPKFEVWLQAKELTAKADELVAEAERLRHEREQAAINAVLQ